MAPTNALRSTLYHRMQLAYFKRPYNTMIRTNRRQMTFSTCLQTFCTARKTTSLYQRQRTGFFACPWRQKHRKTQLHEELCPGTEIALISALSILRNDFLGSLASNADVQRSLPAAPKFIFCYCTERKGGAKQGSQETSSRSQRKIPSTT